MEKRKHYLTEKEKKPCFQTQNFLLNEKEILKRILEKDHEELRFFENNHPKIQKKKERIKEDIQINTQKIKLLKQTIINIEENLKAR